MHRRRQLVSREVPLEASCRRCESPLRATVTVRTTVPGGEVVPSSVQGAARRLFLRARCPKCHRRQVSPAFDAVGALGVGVAAFALALLEGDVAVAAGGALIITLLTAPLLMWFGTREADRRVRFG